jgi:hypothetical protein
MYVEDIIVNKIRKIDPTIDWQRSDKKMLQLACKDFTNYIKFKGISPNSRCFEDNLEKFSKKNREELEAFLNIWSSAWIKKWQERVKLLIGKQDKKDLDSKTCGENEPEWQNLDCKQELINNLGFILVNDGEICSSEMLAEHVLKAELAKKDVDFNDKGQALTFLNNVTKRAHEIAKSRGPLIFVEINKGYYNSVMNQSIN